jgi:hypothetical protein
MFNHRCKHANNVTKIVNNLFKLGEQALKFLW